MLLCARDQYDRFLADGGKLRFRRGQNLALRYEDLDEAVIRDSAFVSVGGAMALPELDGEGASEAVYARPCIRRADRARYARE